MALTPVIPQELIDAIIDHLFSDRSALAACSLVCKAWISRSRHHLLSDVCLSPITVPFILSLPPPSAFASYGRRLMIRSMASLPDGIEHFSSIEALFINHFNHGPATLSRLPSIFPVITVLELQSDLIVTFNLLINFICSFPLLRTLTLSRFWLTSPELTPNNLRLPESLRELNIRTPKLNFVLNWLNSLEHTPRLSTIRMYDLLEEHIPSVSDTLRVLGSSLQHLELELWDHAHADIFCEHINFNHNTALRSFTLHNGWPKLFRDLLESGIHHSQLEEATVTIYADRVPHLDLLDWASLDRLITDPRTAFRLTRLTFRVFTLSEMSEVTEDVVQSRLPLCAAHGIVRFVSERERLQSLSKALTGPIARRSWGDLLSG
ncbi:hypothetical protein Hypma_000550 [Hypsizygus marmoreus]|uniref:F-box domain-containing protein n=1 Tax=Hypsizygus marmoreus TaxID=39966 RepID=A0A369JAQ7_HYPMA|nr:hypothetical protein Hypma_000550 [Hypsizygus marmoreus]